MTTQLQSRATRHRFERQVASAVRAQCLFQRGEHVLVAVSGGPDSVALLAALVALAPAWRLHVSALHVNYGLRGEESDGDERFVVRLCAEWKVPLIRERIELPRTAASLQALARQVRYDALRRAADRIGAGKIAIGHTADDQAETLLMRLLRGGGAAGLAGIRPVRDRVYIRPLLRMRRVDVLAYLEEKGLAFRTDSSNAKPLYLRNRIRHELLPALARFNPSIVDVLAREAEILREEDTCLRQEVSEWMARHVRRDRARAAVPRKDLLQLPVALQRRVLRELVREAAGRAQGPAFGAVDAVLEKVVKGRTGASLSLGGVQVAREYEVICVIPAPQVPFRAGVAGNAGMIRIGIPSVTLWPPTGQWLRLSLVEGMPAPAGRQAAHFDADRFTHRLMLRSWQAGDVFCPQGMGGRRKKLQDYFSDIKLPRERRGTVPLLVAPEGILWIVGYRTDHRFGVTAATRRILTVEVGPVETEREDRH